jgi:prepilin-type N-terminal cleavage/methylation domain-containing protein
MRIHASRCERGFTLIEILIVVAIIGVLIALAVPNFQRYRHYVHKDICIENLAQIQAAKQIWGVENNKGPTAEADEAEIVGQELYIKVKPKCPSGGEYLYKSIDIPAICTFGGDHIAP